MSSTQIATTSPAQGIVATMAAQHNMNAAAFEATLRATVVPKECTREQFAAFLMVAKQYGLNPLTKEIYAYPAKGGIQPIVSVDGWMQLMNSHLQMDGLEFQDHVAEGGEVTAITCRVFRKDRAHPISVTEYLAECKRPTDPWRTYPKRMLRHKAAIQAARYAFGFSGIVDPDEFERIASAPAVVAPTIQARALPPPHDPQTGEIIEAKLEPVKAPPVAKPNGKAPPMKAAAVKAPEAAADMMELALPSPDAVLGELELRLADCGDAAELELIELDVADDAALSFPADKAKARALIDAAKERIGA